MGKYIFQLRRGWKDDSTGRNDWVTYEESPNYMKPLEGELVLEYDNGIPRLKIGDGEHKFSELPYMSVDSFILPKPIYVKLKKNDWTQDTDNRWYQDIRVENAKITQSSKVDLQPKAEDLCVFATQGFSFVVENDSGNLRVYCVGRVPLDEADPDGDYEIPATVTEVTPINGVDKIIGNTTTTPNVQNATIENNILIIE